MKYILKYIFDCHSDALTLDAPRYFLSDHALGGESEHIVPPCINPDRKMLLISKILWNVTKNLVEKKFHTG